MCAGLYEHPVLFFSCFCLLGNKRLRKQILISGDGESTRPQKKQEATIEIETAQRNGYLIEEEKTVSFIVGDFDMPEVGFDKKTLSND